jgi:hypothetical protein
MRALLLAPLLAFFFLTACGDLPSIEPLATKDNTVFDPALVGVWNSKSALVISQKGDDQSYKISWLNTGEPDTAPARMEARLARVGDQRILDLTSADPGAFAIPCHVFLRVRPVNEGLKVQFVDSKWLRDQVKTSSLESFLWEENPVLTASSSRLAAFLLQFGLDQRALDDGLLLHPLPQD